MAIDSVRSCLWTAKGFAELVRPPEDDTDIPPPDSVSILPYNIVNRQYGGSVV